MIVLAAFAALLMVLTGIFLSYWIPAGQFIDRERARVQFGIVALRAERVTRPAFFEPVEGNSWDLFSKGLVPFGLLDEAECSAFASLREAEGVPEPDAEVIARAIKTVEVHFKVLRDALRRTSVEPDYPYEEGLAMKLPLVSLSLKATRILGDRATMLHDEGQTSEAVDRLILGWGVGDRIAVKGFLVMELVRIVCGDLMSNQLKKMVSDYKFASADLARLENALALIDENRPDMMACYRREDIMGASSIIDYLDGKGDNSLIPNWSNNVFSRIPLRFMAVSYFRKKPELDREIEKAVALSIPERQKRLDELTNEVTTERSSIFLVLLTPALMKCWKQHAIDVQTIAMTRLAIALARHREEQGGFPSKLEGLAPRYLPSIPRDPFTGQAFEYAIEDGAAKFWAWGDDGDNDGGRPVDESLDSVDDAEGDIVWTVKKRP